MKTILLMTHFESSVFRAIAESISICSKKRGWALHIITAADAENAKGIAESWHADGCIVYASSPSGLNLKNINMNVPTVHISPVWECKSKLTVSHDSCITGCVAAHELGDLGLDNFAFAANHPMPPWAEKRLSTYRSELVRRGRTANVYDGGDLRAWLRSLPKPCGIFAANDMMAERIVATAKTEGLEVPYDLAVLGCDDDVRICENAETTISSIRPDYAKGGMLAVQMLADAMDGRNGEPVQKFGDLGAIHRASTRVTAYRSPVISDALEYIRLNAFSGISASDVLSRMKGSRRSAENMFRAATGHSILEEIQSVRLNEVKRLLSNPLMKIGAIAAQTGYRSENFLTRLFKRETGMTPSQWRKSHTYAE
ncbi:MAG: substrate-binding domain-containing protein [Kiritimatiellae bacterium]|nr:substrate-binding domain-containing protein [Kiritimatiellia bacterium]